MRFELLLEIFEQCDDALAFKTRAFEVEFRVVANSSDDGDPESNAVLAGLDLVDLINLRDALQQEIDNYALSALEAEAANTVDTEDEELLP